MAKTSATRPIDCPLCGNAVAALHPRSHIVPEWAYKALYDETNTAVALDLPKTKRFKKQGGYYGRIQCGGCEKYSQLFDAYAALILGKRSPDAKALWEVNVRAFSEEHKGVTLEWLQYRGLKFHLLQRFVLGVVLSPLE